MTKLAVFRRCATLEEALVVDSLLQSGGFQSSTPVRYHGANDWFLVPALNGVPVFVPEPELMSAGEYLVTARKHATTSLEAEFGLIDTTPFENRWGRGLTMIFLYLGAGTLLWWPIAFLLSLLPPEWLRPAEPSEFFGETYYSVKDYSSPNGFDALGSLPPQFLYIVFLTIFLIFEFASAIARMDTQAKYNAPEDTRS